MQYAIRRPTVNPTKSPILKYDKVCILGRRLPRSKNGSFHYRNPKFPVGSHHQLNVVDVTGSANLIEGLFQGILRFFMDAVAIVATVLHQASMVITRTTSPLASLIGSPLASKDS